VRRDSSHIPFLLLLRYRNHVFLAYTLLLYRLLLPASPANDHLQRIIDDSMIHRQGAAVALDVETGQVLASYRMDVAARRLAAPGSAIKPFTLMALLDAGLVKEETSLFCPRTVRIGTHILDCSHPRSPETLDPVMALAYSCNHFFTAMSARLPFDALPREFSRVGLNSVTGKWQTELPGVVDQPHSKQAMQLMSVGEEGIKVTPLALAEAYSSLARPLRNAQTTTPELRLVLKGLRAVVNSGTGQAASSKSVQVAGKTGTFDGHAWFAGFAPAESPEMVVVVFLERGTGGADAAPIAGRIFDAYYTSHTSRGTVR
jgi:cell division protein FtsI/penicillin-binding protein 2